MPDQPSANSVIKRKTAVFRCAVLLMFFTSMSKVLVPGAVFDEMQGELGLDAAVLASMGSWYMLAYACSQFIFGILAERLGGTRILLIGGSTFCTGMILFPFCSSPGIMMPLRILTGFGAGIVFIGLAKLIADLYIERFSYILGFSLVIGYLGPVTGMGPMVGLVKAIGWRPALFIPAAISCLTFTGIVLFAKHTFSRAGAAQPIWRPVAQVMGHGTMIRICLASSIMFGCYYALLNIMGRKCLEDMELQGARWPTVFMTALALTVVFLNLMGGTISKRTRGHYGLTMKVVTLLALVGAVLGWLAMRNGWGSMALVVSYISFCIPAGLFPLYCAMAKEGIPQEHTALAVALVNFWAFVLISLVGDLAGRAMARNEHLARKVGDVLVYPPAAYQDIFLVFMVFLAIAFAATFGLFKPRRQAI